MAQGTPAPTRGAHFNTDVDRSLTLNPLVLPPGPGFFPGGFQGVVEIIEHRMGCTVTIDKPKQPWGGVAARTGRRLWIRKHSNRSGSMKSWPVPAALTVRFSTSSVLVGSPDPSSGLQRQMVTSRIAM